MSEAKELSPEAKAALAEHAPSFAKPQATYRQVVLPPSAQVPASHYLLDQAKREMVSALRTTGIKGFGEAEDIIRAIELMIDAKLAIYGGSAR